MSVIAAYHEGNTVVIGSDTIAFSGVGRRFDVGPKWYTAGDGWWIGIVGDGRICDVIQHNIHFMISAAAADDADVLRALPRRMIETFENNSIRPHFPADWTAPAWIDSAIVANPRGIWDIDAQLSINQVPEGVFWARGCGAEAAMGAAWALSRSAIHGTIRPAPTSLMYTAIDAARGVNHHVDGSWIRTVRHPEDINFSPETPKKREYEFKTPLSTPLYEPRAETRAELKEIFAGEHGEANISGKSSNKD